VTETWGVSYFPLSYSPLNGVTLRLIGLGSAGSGVWVDTDEVRVAMGRVFRARFPRKSVRSIGRDTAFVDGWGVHGWHGRWLVNGSSSGIVRLDLEPGARARVLGVPVRLNALRVSLTTPDELIRVLG
jgi:hypothetical protein